MGRRSDHNRDELRDLILDAGERLVAEVGFADFSAREVAKRVGYSIGTIHNVFGNVDRLVTAINTRTFAIWADALESALEGAPADANDDRIAVLVAAYFRFARDNPRRWAAIYDHRPAAETITPEQEDTRGRLLKIVVAEVATALGRAPDDAVGTLARSLVATVHGHCSFAVTGSWEAMGQRDVEAAALARVRESLAAANAQTPTTGGSDR